MFDLDDMIKRLKVVKDQPIGTSAGLSVEEINYICQTVQPIFMSQPTLLEIKPPLTIVGDVHGQYHDLMRIFELNKYPPDTRYLFLGDYVDRGKNSIECLCLLLIYKIKYPNDFYMLRGNHECSYINRLYGFYDECVKTYSLEVWRMFADVFNRLPIAAIVEDKIFCVHGGLSPHLESLDQIRDIPRPIEVPEEGLLCDLLWSDPSPEAQDWEDNERGTSYCFGLPQVETFLQKFDFDLICRAHQAIMEGFEFPFQDSQCLVTVFSAPNYCYEYENKGAILNVDDSLFCNFTVLEPKKWEEDYYIGPRPGTPPRCSDEEGEMEFQVQAS